MGAAESTLNATVQAQITASIAANSAKILNYAEMTAQVTKDISDLKSSITDMKSRLFDETDPNFDKVDREYIVSQLNDLSVKLSNAEQLFNDSITSSVTDMIASVNDALSIIATVSTNSATNGYL
jgi:aspartate/tyrosine/aromatic aminotransferase